MASKILRKVISTPKAPAAIGPYSQAVQAGNTLYVSGQLGMDPQTMNLVSGDVVEQTKTALTNMGHILEAAGCTYKHVVKTTVLLADINDFVKVNEVYSTFFSEAVPARAAYQVANLPKGGRVEIEAIAVVGELDQQ
ncbi:2-iminobutanoate/2-iminopropanoate deaminase-like [Homarus americanus]|uniref:2-iminobutanoate/2-iminopropanoate deaminase-like n=1 Tax=Homarus americanus TaxID=6706 RepID=A0A8J5KCC5_HOMAM|nr:2-iminobutanoate/2-iminopropanoate deaminase-like [Homarus americanus]KAG7170291.1 2-iminobutanoate/2-iminopropanoate deaminase-like [Homarus americanus]